MAICVITSAGAALVRDAMENSTKFVLTRARFGSAFENDRGDLASKTADFFDGGTGSVDAVSTYMGTLAVSVSFSAADDSIPVKSICICGQPAKDGIDPEYSEADDVVVLAWSDDNSCLVSGAGFAMNFEAPIPGYGLIDDDGAIPNPAGVSVVSFTEGEGGADGVLVLRLSDGTEIEVAANPASP